MRTTSPYLPYVAIVCIAILVAIVTAQSPPGSHGEQSIAGQAYRLLPTVDSWFKDSIKEYGKESQIQKEGFRDPLKEKEFLDEIEKYDPYCGDGILNGADECDDGNTFNGDGCSEACIIEPIWYLDNYASLAPVKTTLQQMRISTFNGNYVTGYQLVSDLLQNGYDGFASNQQKESFIEAQLSPYNFLQGPGRPWPKAYILSIVHSLWFEKQQSVPWSLEDYNSDEIESLFWVNALNPGRLPPTTLRQTMYDVDGINLEAHGDTIYKLFSIAYPKRGADHLTTIKNLITWQKKNFFHAYYEYDWEEYRDGRPGFSLGPRTLERLFEERITSCHHNNIVFASLLRSLNIPASKITVAGHGVTYLTTIDRYVHGDHLADFVLVPAEAYLLTVQDVIPLATNPAGYDRVMRGQYPYPRHYFPNPELHRDGDHLHIETDSVCTNIPPEDWQAMREEVPEFNLQYDQARCQISSDRVPIQPLR